MRQPCLVGLRVKKAKEAAAQRRNRHCPACVAEAAFLFFVTIYTCRQPNTFLSTNDEEEIRKSIFL